MLRLRGITDYLRAALRGITDHLRAAWRVSSAVAWRVPSPLAGEGQIGGATRASRSGGVVPPFLSFPREGGRNPLSSVRVEPIGPDPFPVGADAERIVDRRRFLWAATAAAAVTVAGEWVARGAAAARPARLEVEHDAIHPLAVGDAHATMTSGGADALIVRLDASTVVGFARRCPHLGCPVLWAPERGRFECPCHHAAFDARTGRVLFGPPRRGLEPVTIRTA